MNNNAHTKFDISIIIPTRARKTLTFAVMSALNQTHCNSQVVIVGDHVDIKSINDLLPKNTENIKIVINDIMPGAPASRNIGIRSSDSDLIAFLDDDDLLLPSYYASLRPALEKYEIVSGLSIKIHSQSTSSISINNTGSEIDSIKVKNPGPEDPALVTPIGGYNALPPEGARGKSSPVLISE